MYVSLYVYLYVCISALCMYICPLYVLISFCINMPWYHLYVCHLFCLLSSAVCRCEAVCRCAIYWCIANSLFPCESDHGLYLVTGNLKRGPKAGAMSENGLPPVSPPTDRPSVLPIAPGRRRQYQRVRCRQEAVINQEQTCKTRNETHARRRLTLMDRETHQSFSTR